MPSQLTFWRHAAVTTLLVSAWCVTAVGQQKSDSPDEATVQQWIQNLDAPAFSDRLTAESQLLKLGPDAVRLLKQAEKSSSLEHRLRIQSVLRKLEETSLESRLAVLEKTLSAEAVVALPEGRRFIELAGSDPAAVRLFVRLFRAEAQLFAQVPGYSNELTKSLEQRASELLQSTRPTGETPGTFSVDSMAALLLLCSDENIRLGNASTAVSTMLQQTEFEAALKQDNNTALNRLVGAYILRDRIAPARPLTLARRQRLPEGLLLARRVVSKGLRGTDGLFAMMLIAEQGSEKEIALLEEVFGNRGLLLNQGTAYSVTNGDMAMAVAIHLRGRDPREFGFAPGQDRQMAFQFAPETTGFRSEEDRFLARESYQKTFGTPAEVNK